MRKNHATDTDIRVEYPEGHFEEASMMQQGFESNIHNASFQNDKFGDYFDEFWLITYFNSINFEFVN